MTDYSELKRLAEAARAEQERVIKLAANGEGWEALPAQSSFRCVADPAAVLALIRQNERLRAGVDDDLAEVERIEGEYTKQWRKARALRIERDQLKTEVEALRKDAARLDRLDEEREAYGTSFHEGNRWMLDGQFATVRDAIDAAMSKEAGQ